MAKGFSGVPGNMQALMKQANKMQADLEKVQAEAAVYEATGTAGGGAVKAVVNGQYQLVSLSIDPAMAGDVTTLEETVTVAVNQAVAAVKTHTDESLKKVTGGLSLPGLF